MIFFIESPLEAQDSRNLLGYTGDPVSAPAGADALSLEARVRRCSELTFPPRYFAPLRRSP